MKQLLAADLLHGDCITITGRTVAENLADVPEVTPPQIAAGPQVIRPVADPMYAPTATWRSSKATWHPKAASPRSPA